VKKRLKKDRRLMQGLGESWKRARGISAKEDVAEKELRRIRAKLKFKQIWGQKFEI
jgi:hypothetical protein